jgi:hypothetical protein
MFSTYHKIQTDCVITLADICRLLVQYRGGGEGVGRGGVRVFENTKCIV